MTTIVSVRRNGIVAVGGDGQVTMGQSTILKGNARKVRKIFHNKVICGFAGSTADAFTLLDLFEKKLEEHQGILERACIALAKLWRSDRALRKLEAILIVADKNASTSTRGCHHPVVTSTSEFRSKTYSLSTSLSARLYPPAKP